MPVTCGSCAAPWPIGALRPWLLRRPDGDGSPIIWPKRSGSSAASPPLEAACQVKAVFWRAAPSSDRWCFADNDRPGVMTGLIGTKLHQPLCAEAWANGRWSSPITTVRLRCRRWIMSAAGIEVAAVIDLRAACSGRAPDRAKPKPQRSAHPGRPRHHRHQPARSASKNCKVAPLAELSAEGDRSTVGTHKGAETIDCDLVAVVRWLEPEPSICSAMPRASLRMGRRPCLFRAGQGNAGGPAVLGRFLPTAPSGSPPAWPRAAEAGRTAAAAEAGFEPRQRAVTAESEDRDLPAWALVLVAGARPTSRWARKAKHFVDQQNDVTAADLKLALREGYRLDRARQALHHHGHGDRPGQDWAT